MVAIASALYYTLPYMVGPPKACNLTKVEQRNFYKYYGLSKIDNPLLYENAEQGGSTNSKCTLFYDHMLLLPPGTLPVLRSIIIKADRGAGKTQIRQCILSRLSQKSHIFIKIFGTVINNYLDNFNNNVDIPYERPHEKIQKYWTKEDFLQVILTELSSRFIDGNYKSMVEEKRNYVSLQTRKQVASLVSFYSTQDSLTLCKMVNALLHDERDCSSGFFFSSDCKIPCEDDQLRSVDNNMLIQLTEKQRKVKVIRRTIHTEASLRVLIAIQTKTKFSPIPMLESSYRDQLVVLISFLNTLNINISIIVDSLDESSFFFNKDDPNLTALQRFLNSVTHDDILTLGLGNTGEGTKISNPCSFYIFIPQKPTVQITIPWSRPDKIPIIDMKWDESELINYADYVLDYLRSKSDGSCKSLPNICSLLGGQKLCIDAMRQLRHPRDFHIFFKILTQHMSTVCTQRNPPFIATQKDVETVSTKTKSRILKD